MRSPVRSLAHTLTRWQLWWMLALPVWGHASAIQADPGLGLGSERTGAVSPAEASDSFFPEDPQRSAFDHDLRAFSLEALRALGTKRPESPCVRGGSIHPECRRVGERWVVVAELRSCGLLLSEGEVAGVTGEFVMALPPDQSCDGDSHQICGPITVERVHLVGTVTNDAGKVVRVADFSVLPQPHLILVPCLAGARGGATS
ncbi:MAG: hypothetical protein KatS3mg077_2114 [Candidatus Binatia bacterium]|nr:MAG: hypothetical protein KatS3mg077_2114 [Candidatus Binatia bacterium]